MSTKSFDDSTRYAAAIRRLVPGYDLVHSMIAPLLLNRLEQQSKVLIIGSGVGNSVVALAQAGPQWIFKLGYPLSEQV